MITLGYSHNELQLPAKQYRVQQMYDISVVAIRQRCKLPQQIVWMRWEANATRSPKSMWPPTKTMLYARRIYRLKPSEDQRPAALICASDSPRIAAAVADPILKLWPLKWDVLRPEKIRRDFKAASNSWRTIGVPSGREQRGACTCPLAIRNSCRILNGSILVPSMSVLFTRSVWGHCLALCLKWRKWTVSTSSTMTTSPSRRQPWTSDLERGIISPIRRYAWKARTMIIRIIRDLYGETNTW